MELLKESLGGVDLSAISEEDVTQMLALVGLNGQGLPARMADINGVLDELPADVREKLLIGFVNDLFTQ